MSERVNFRGLVLGLAALAVVASIVWLRFGANSGGPPAPNANAAGPRPLAASVAVARPQIKPFAQAVEALGTVRANESVDITAKVTDRVVAIHFEEGQHVRKGQLLVELDSAEARAELAAAEAALSESRSQFKRSEELYRTQALSEAQRDQLQATLLANEARVAAARARLADRTIVAPFAGRVGLRNVSVGSLVNPGQVITTLDDLSVVKLDFAVPEVFLAILKRDLPVVARTDAYPGVSFEGRVASIGTRVDPATRSVTIRALIDNAQRRLHPGMFMTVQLVQAEPEALMLAERAIVPEDNRHYVFVVDGGLARKREVRIGRRRPGEVEILAGITPDDVVIVDGVLNVRDGLPVRVQADVTHPTVETPT